jgi:5-formyltetrahydrofolate cyclo-ligase
MDKQELREHVWDTLEDSGEARFPYPPHGRIPNYAGAADAAERLSDLPAWKEADVIMANPDSPQLPVRRAALRQGKIVYMAVPRLRDEKCFLRLDPREIDDSDNPATISGSSEAGIPVSPTEMQRVDLIVSGSVAVNPKGVRVGKGEGYSDLEFAILSECEIVDDDTVTTTTVHELQITSEDVSSEDYDVSMDYIFTPSRTIQTDSSTTKPSKLKWDNISNEKISEIPILRRLRPE